MMRSDGLANIVGANISQAVTTLSGIKPEISPDVVIKFVQDVIHERAKTYGTIGQALDQLPVIEHEHRADRVLAGWWIEGRPISPHMRIGQVVPRFSDLILAVWVLGFDVELVARWLDQDQSRIVKAGAATMHWVTPSDRRLSPDDVPYVHRIFSHLLAVSPAQYRVLDIGDVHTLAVLGRLTDPEIVALCTNTSSHYTVEIRPDQYRQIWVPDLVGLSQYWEAPPEKKFYWKPVLEMTSTERRTIAAQFPGVPSTYLSDALLRIARGMPASSQFPELTRAEVHEFIYTTDWHASVADGDPQEVLERRNWSQWDYLLCSLGLRRYVSLLPPRAARVYRWFKHQLDLGKEDLLRKTRMFRDGYGLPYHSCYLDRMDEVREMDIVAMSDGLVKVFANVDRRMREMVDEDALEGLDDPICKRPDFADKLPTGWRVLLTRRELIEEGRRVKHCVAMYHHAVRDGQCLILSIQDEHGMSTAELRSVVITNDEDEESWTYWNLIQHRSIRNGVPPKAHALQIQQVIPNLIDPESLK